MESVSFEGANRNLTAPVGRPEVGELPVYSDGEACLSCWRLSWREVVRVLLRRRVWLWVASGSTQPPVALAAEACRELRKTNERGECSALWYNSYIHDQHGHRR